MTPVDVERNGWTSDDAPEPHDEYHCPNCRALLPKEAYDALMKKAARGEHAECDECPY